MAEIGEIPGTWRAPLAPQDFDAVSKTPEATTDERWERLQNRQTRVTKQIEFVLRNKLRDLTLNMTNLDPTMTIMTN